MVEEAKSKGCTVVEIEEKKIDTREEQSESDEELPPSLEQIST